MSCESTQGLWPAPNRYFGAAMHVTNLDHSGNALAPCVIQSLRRKFLAHHM